MVQLCVGILCIVFILVFCFQAEDGIRDLVRSRGLGDVYKRQGLELDGIGPRLCRGLDGLQRLVEAVTVVRRELSLSLIHI